MNFSEILIEAFECTLWTETLPEEKGANCGSMNILIILKRIFTVLTNRKYVPRTQYVDSINTFLPMSSRVHSI